MISSHDPTYPLYPVLSFIGGILCLIPLPWHLQAWNSGTCAFMFWTALSCFVSFTNSIIWHGNIDNPAPVWCDISSKIIIGTSVAIPAATLCISRRLYYLTSGNTVSITPEDKRRMVIIDLGLSMGIPVIIMALHYIVQGHRFDILEDFGCYPVVYNTLPAYFIYYSWPIILGAISFVFSTLTLRSFWIRRAQFNQLITSKSSMSVSRYFRLVLLSAADITCTLPFAIYSIYIGNKDVTLSPWISWEETHFNFSRVGLVPAIIWRMDPTFRIGVELTRWLPVICAFVFFTLFGFASEATRHYRLAFSTVLKVFGVRRSLKATIVDRKGDMKASPPRYAWTKPQQLDTLSTSMGSLPTFVTSKAQLSPSTSSFGPKMGRSYSFSTSTSTRAGDELELHSIDIEKSAGLSSPSFSEASVTCYASPPPGYSSRPQPHLVPMDISIAEVDDIEDIYLPPSPLPKPESEATDTLPLPVSTTSPERKLSNSSMRTITSPDRDRFYIPSSVAHVSSNEDLRRTPSPPSPPPFARTTITTLNPDDQETRRSPHIIQVMVHKTETQSHEDV